MAAGLLMTAPAVVLSALFILAPLAFAVHDSLHETDIVMSKYVGILNYVRLVGDPGFLKAITNTLFYTLTIAGGELAIGLGVAMYVYNMGKGAQSLARFAFYVPTFAAGIIISNVWKWIFHPSAGLANYLLSIVGLSPTAWTASRLGALSVVSFIIVTSAAGFMVMILIAALTEVPKEIVEAAQIDGARLGLIKWRILFPCILPQFLVCVLLAVISASQIWETIYLMTNGGPDGGSASILFNAYQTAFVYGKHGMAAAKTVTLVLLCLGINGARKRIGGERA